jgi:hypothetical protein
MVPTKKVSLSVLLLLTGFFQSILVQAQEKPLSDSAYISLITVSPGEEIYAHYGHTALRVVDAKNGFDLVFNYGLFDFNSPNFIFRFVRGETDYVCGAFIYSDFLLEYQDENRNVSEQILNLKPQEKESIWQALVKNIQPENRTYRYNFFFNNCSTKPRDVIVNGLHGKVDYRTEGYYPTLRSVIHHYTNNHPWTQFGIDFLIGAQADDSATLSDQQFAPEILAESFSKAVVVEDSAKTRPLVLETRQAVSSDTSRLEKPFHLPGPLFVTWFLFLLVAACSMYEFLKKKHFQAVTAVLYGIFGITGSLIAFLVLFSIHPTTHVNYLLLWQNPLHLIFAFGMIFGSFRKKIAKPYLAANILLQLLAIVGIWIFPQHLHPAMYPLLMMMLMRSALGVYQLRKN